MLIEEFDSYERFPMSAPVRTWLCDLAAGDLDQPLARVNVDWAELFQAVCRNGLVGLACGFLQENRDSFVPAQFRQWVREAYVASTVRMMMVYKAIVPLLRQLDRAGLDYFVVKGPALAHKVYPDPAWRAFNDLDLVVREQDWSLAHREMLKMGFTSEENLAEPPPKLIPQDVLYEQRYHHKGTGLVVEVHYDDLLNAGLASRDFEGFWRRTIRVPVEGIPVRALCLEDQLLHLCAHAHFHGYVRLNSLSDIALLLRRYGRDLNWDQFIETARVEEAQVPVFYTLRYVQELLRVTVPDRVVAALTPDRFRQWWHQRYLPDDEVLSLQPMPRPDFSFYFLSLYRRLLPDLLVMGRRREKLSYLVRLLAPSAEWLCYYYGLDREQSVGWTALMHPAKLVGHYIAETAERLGCKVRRLAGRILPPQPSDASVQRESVG